MSFEALYRNLSAMYSSVRRIKRIINATPAGWDARQITCYFSALFLFFLFFFFFQVYVLAPTIPTWKAQ